MLTLQQKIRIAHKEKGRSVIKINENAMMETEAKSGELYTFGVKNTNAIPKDIFNKLREKDKYLFLTIDKMSDMGRSIDTDILNPLTYRPMTGSSSGGPVNILKGINDFAIGTDGGGSVLAPALSCNLPSIIGAGLGLLTSEGGKSTDNFNLTPSIGIIAKDLELMLKVVEDLLDTPIETQDDEEITVLIPKIGDVQLPLMEDMRSVMVKYISKISGYNFKEFSMRDIGNRKDAMEVINKAFNEEKADIILTYEGPIDLFGYGETIPGTFAGKAGTLISEKGGKFMVKAANIAGITAITVPSDELASGFVICAPKGMKAAGKAVRLAKSLNEIITLPEVFTRYYINKEKYVEEFSLD
ncbi:amidase family protein [Clostridium polynesiense]|uniref:amidase family protein n=1 Tax=Clostridium polynesiense TaxID=1325933 RepID=UPI000693ABD4|nr:amidase family protein [Clostridium polynesiense]